MIIHTGTGIIINMEIMNRRKFIKFVKFVKFIKFIK
jgi:hypothetical protein